MPGSHCLKPVNTTKSALPRELQLKRKLKALHRSIHEGNFSKHLKTLSPEFSPWQGHPRLPSRAGFSLPFLSRYGYGQNFILLSPQLSGKFVQKKCIGCIFWFCLQYTKLFLKAFQALKNFIIFGKNSAYT